MQKIKIEDHFVGDGEPCFIIAEAGSNHNGNLELAKKLIDIAVDAKVDAIKFQTFRADKLYPKTSGAVEYLKRLGVTKNIYDIIKENEMPYEWIEILARYCKKNNIIFLSTPFDEMSADILDEFVPAFKLASYEITHIPLIEHIAKKGKPVIISTGAANLQEVREAIEAVYRTGNKAVCLLQCTAKYPTPIDSVNVNVVKELKLKFNVPVGLSDHSRNHLIAPIAAVSVGANILEKHFTISNILPGPDHMFALEPSEIKEMVQNIRLVERALGSGEKGITNIEAELVKYRRAVYTKTIIKKGETLSSENLVVLRKPGLAEPGISPKDINKIIGKKSTRDLSEGHLISNEDVEW